jgi:tripartite-type tricarboxylate transporter receptor subunit TctC
VRIVVSFAAGGPTDAVARILGATARPDRNESGFPRHAGGASLTH